MFKNVLGTLSDKGRKSFALAVFFYLLQGLSYLLVTVISFDILFKITRGTSVNEIVSSLVLVALLILTRGFVGFIADVKKHEVTFDVENEVRKKLIERLKLFGLGFYTNQRLGEIGTVLQKDVGSMSGIVGHVWAKMFADIILAVITLVGLALYNYMLAIAMVAVIPFALLFLSRSIKNSESFEEENSKSLMNMTSAFVEYVRGIYVIKSFSNNKFLDRDIKEKTNAFGKTSVKVARRKGGQISFYIFLLDLAYILLITLGTLSVIGGSLDVFVFIMFAVLSKEFYKPFYGFISLYTNYISAADSYKRISKILSSEVLKDNTLGKAPTDNEIVFENVEFSYEDDGFKMENMNFTTKENTMTALVGGSGSGKTTITNLLLRFYDVDNGSIKIGGTDIRDIPYDELLDKISIVMQNVQMFNKTIRENIAVGKRNATDEEIIEAAKKARIHDFIMTLENGYDTPVGENGGFLSGGQKQRISIARAFLKNASILILDEMTSNVDPLDEVLIQQAITELTKNRTVIVIAHRLKTIQNAEQILVFDKGVLVERGTSKSLIERNGYYTNLWNSQFV